MQDHSLDRAVAARELQQLLFDTDHITGFLDELARYAATTIGPDLSCGITMNRHGGPLTVASSDAEALGMDEVQYGHHDGRSTSTRPSRRCSPPNGSSGPRPSATRRLGRFAWPCG